MTVKEMSKDGKGKGPGKKRKRTWQERCIVNNIFSYLKALVLKRAVEKISAALNVYLPSQNGVGSYYFRNKEMDLLFFQVVLWIVSGS